jgi:hypothetical protein
METEVLGENLSQCHFICHESNMTWLVQTGSPQIQKKDCFLNWETISVLFWRFTILLRCLPPFGITWNFNFAIALSSNWSHKMLLFSDTVSL